MKEYGNHKSKIEEYFERHKDCIIDKGSDYVCSKCKKIWYPTIEDVNAKRLWCYYKGCTSCRFKSFTKAREYKERDKLKDASIS